MKDYEILEQTLITNKSIPPGDCSECHYYALKTNKCSNLPEESVVRCRENGYVFGMMSIYLKSYDK